MANLKIAVIGSRQVGLFHARCFQALENSQFVGAVGTRPGRGAAFGAQYGVPGFDSLEELVRDTGAQVLSICTPHPFHAGYAVEAARLGLHIAIEKPLASSLQDCDRMIQAVEAAGVKGCTISQRRYYLPAIRVKQAILDGKIGKPIGGTENMLGWRSIESYASAP